MRICVFVGLVVFTALGYAQGHRPDGQRIGDLLIELTSIDTPDTLGLPSDHHWVQAALTFRNVGREAVCAVFLGSLKADSSLIVRNAAMSISELLPGMEIRRTSAFFVKTGADPLELTLETESYGRDGCGSALPRDAIRSVVFPIRGIASPVPVQASAPELPPPDVGPVTLPGPSGCSSGVAIPFGAPVPGVAIPFDAPVPIYQPDPEYTDQARQAKWQGSVVLYFEIDKTGKPVPGCMRVWRSLGLGLDEKAVEAVEKWRFKPSIKNGRPTSVMATVEVTFRLQ